MSIASAIQAKQQQVADSYTAVSNKGGTLPATQNLTNLATAISSIPSGSSPTLITKSITVNGTYNASSDNADGYSSVTVNVSGYSEFPNYQVDNGVANKRSGALTGNEFSGITNVGTYGLEYAFYQRTGITGTVDFSSLTTASGAYGFQYAFYGCTGLTNVDFSSLTTASGGGCFRNAFQGCTGLTNVDFSSLTTVKYNYIFQNAFYGCTGLTNVDFSSLTTASGYQAFQNAFYGCTGLTNVDFSSLGKIGDYTFQYAFYGCTGLTNVYFRKLKTTSFTGSYSFGGMMQNTGTSTTHTLHFPSNLESKISTLGGYPLFGGTSGYVVCAFDLPATS